MMQENSKARSQSWVILPFLINKSGKTTHVGIYAGKNAKGEAVWIHGKQ